MSSFNLLFRVTFHWDTLESIGGHRFYFIFANVMKLESCRYCSVSRGDRGSSGRKEKKKRKPRHKISLDSLHTKMEKKKNPTTWLMGSKGRGSIHVTTAPWLRGTSPGWPGHGVAESLGWRDFLLPVGYVLLQWAWALLDLEGRREHEGASSRG